MSFCARERILQLLGHFSTLGLLDSGPVCGMLGEQQDVKPSKNFCDNFSRITMVGAGTTGRAIAEELSRYGIEVFVTDHGSISPETKADLRSLGVGFEEGVHSEKALDVDLLVISPGVSINSEIVRRAKKTSISIMGSLEFSYRLYPRDRIIAVTGTNGKTTTVRFISTILDNLGVSTKLCGNIGNPYVTAASRGSSDTVLVLEISSYQLETIETFSPAVALLLNISPDHLSRHGSYSNYRHTKLRIFENLSCDNWAIIPATFNSNIVTSEAQLRTFSADRIKNCSLSQHNQQNLSAALTAVQCYLGIDRLPDIPHQLVYKKAHKTRHRLDLVTRKNGIEIYDDSKATNPQAVVAALNSMEGPVWLLLGGRLKSVDYSPLIEKVGSHDVSGVYLFGEGKDHLHRLFNQRNFSSAFQFPSMEAATKAAITDACSEGSVLFSPGGSSFDQFGDFKARGEEFRRIVTTSCSLS